MSLSEFKCEIPDEATNHGRSTAAEFYLASLNIESAINDHLLKNGTLICPKTRIFLANLREVIGAMARHARDAA